MKNKDSTSNKSQTVATWPVTVPTEALSATSLHKGHFLSWKLGTVGPLTAVDLKN